MAMQGRGVRWCWLQQQGREGSGARPCEQEGRAVQGEVARGTATAASTRLLVAACARERGDARGCGEQGFVVAA
jgi:hypothetical protein